MDRMLDDWTRKVRIKHLAQSITTTARGGIHDLTNGAQALKDFCVHTMSMPERAFCVYSPSPSPCCWLHGKFLAFLITSLRFALRERTATPGNIPARGDPAAPTRGTFDAESGHSGLQEAYYGAHGDRFQ
jgi:hypothetical protein